MELPSSLACQYFIQSSHSTIRILATSEIKAQVDGDNDKDYKFLNISQYHFNTAMIPTKYATPQRTESSLMNVDTESLWMSLCL